LGRIHPSARIAEGARLGADVEVGPFCTVGPDAVLSDGCRLISHVNVAGHTTIGPRTVVHPFASLGTPPQSVHYKGEASRLVIGADCTIREHVTMNTGTASGRMETRVGNKCFLMISTHIGHDCLVGNEVILVNGVTLAGHCEIGDFAIISGLTALHQFVRVGAYAFIGGLTGLTKDLMPGSTAFGVPAEYRGLNAIGLKRRGFSREAIQSLRGAYRALFADQGPMQERAERLARAFPNDTGAALIVDFIRAGVKRPFLLPERNGMGEIEDFEGEG
jgi:UDP-N-acetylglucosamine acyltransferase